VVDRFSKHVHLIPLTFKGSNAVEVARLFVDNVWKHHGMPRSIVSDRDVRFTSAFWEEFCRLTGIQRDMTTAYTPQSNGGAERANATMETILRAYTEPRGLDWDLHLAAAEYAMNDSMNASIRPTRAHTLTLLAWTPCPPPTGARRACCRRCTFCPGSPAGAGSTRPHQQYHPPA